jgi:hypothetical protein
LLNQGNGCGSSSFAPSSSNGNVRFNNKTYGSWKSGRLVYLTVSKSVKAGSVWEVVEMVATREDDALSHSIANTATRHANWAIQKSGRRNIIVKRSETGWNVIPQVRILHVRRTLVVNFQCAQKGAQIQTGR